MNSKYTKEIQLWLILAPKTSYDNAMQLALWLGILGHSYPDQEPLNRLYNSSFRWLHEYERSWKLDSANFKQLLLSNMISKMKDYPNAPEPETPFTL